MTEFQQPPPPKPWYRTGWGVAGIAIGSSLLLMCACCSGLFVLAARIPTVTVGASSPTASASTPIAFVSPTALGTPSRPGSPTATVRATATAHPTVTATPSPQRISGATVGGTQSAFTARYGIPTSSLVSDTSYQATITTSDGPIPVEINVMSLVRGTDGQQRIDQLYLEDPTATTWNEYSGESVVPAFLPPDARHIRDDQDPNLGTLQVYQSAQLAATFPASAFINTGQGGGIEPPGTFTVNCDPPGADTCTISLGE